MELSIDKIWSAAQEHLRSSMNADTYNMWFAPLRASTIDNNHAVLETPNEFCEVWLKDNYLGLLQKAFAAASGRQLLVKFKTTSANASTVPVTNLGAMPIKVKTGDTAHERLSHNGELPFNPKNTFESFVVGNNNNFSYAAALAVAQAPGKSYNPLSFTAASALARRICFTPSVSMFRQTKKARVSLMCHPKNSPTNTLTRSKTVPSSSFARNIVRPMCC
jgi:chromosomal replication initiator protein